MGAVRRMGYLALLATVIQAAVSGAVLILLPLALLSRRPRAASGMSLPGVVMYFGILGAAFMALEIAFIQKMMLFLSYPVYAVAVVLTAFLFFSGLGSLAAGRMRLAVRRLLILAVSAIAVLSVCYIFLLPPFFYKAAGMPDNAKIILSLALLAPMAFFMGMPFPLGLQMLSDRFPEAVPWAWGINACLSVVGASAATLFAIHFGFRALVAAAVLCYAAAVPVLISWTGFQGRLPGGKT